MFARSKGVQRMWRGTGDTGRGRGWGGWLCFRCSFVAGVAPRQVSMALPFPLCQLQRQQKQFKDITSTSQPGTMATDIYGHNYE